MRQNLMWIAKSLLLALLIVAFGLPSAPIALAQDTATIMFDGKPLTGPSDMMAEFVVQSLRPAVATAELGVVVEDPADLVPFVPRKGCFGVAEANNGFYLLRETLFATDTSNGNYEAVAPPSGGHGDWPPHLPLFLAGSTQPLGCGELQAEISWRLRFAPDQPGTLVFTFMLNPEHLDEYEVMASQGDLGLFVASPTPTVLTVNKETFESEGCADCLAHTRAVTNTTGAGVYTPAMVEWFGTITENTTPLTGMYVLPVKKSIDEIYNVSITLTEEEFANGKKPIVYLWFGRFDMPE